MERKEIYKQAFERWGTEPQYLQAIEEMAELTQLLVRMQRENRKVTYLELSKEIADVNILMEQLTQMHDIEKLVAEQEENQLKKLVGYLEQSKGD